MLKNWARSVQPCQGVVVLQSQHRCALSKSMHIQGHQAMCCDQALRCIERSGAVYVVCVGSPSLDACLPSRVPAAEAQWRRARPGAARSVEASSLQV